MCSVAFLAVLALLPVSVIAFHGTRTARTGRTELVAQPQQPKLQVILAGLPKTATTSLAIALDVLGYPIAHDSATLVNPDGEGFQLWHEKGDISKQLENVLNLKLGQVYGNVSMGVSDVPPSMDLNSTFVGVADVPFGYRWKDLLQLSQNAKVILSIHPRGADAWFDSVMEYSSDFRTMLGQKVLEWELYPNLAVKVMMEEHNKALFPCDVLQPNITDDMRQTCKERYALWTEEVTRGVLPENFLLYNISDGWEPLLEFFGAEHPGVEFPRINTETEGHHLLLDAIKSR